MAVTDGHGVSLTLPSITIDADALRTNIAKAIAGGHFKIENIEVSKANFQKTLRDSVANFHLVLHNVTVGADAFVALRRQFKEQAFSMKLDFIDGTGAIAALRKKLETMLTGITIGNIDTNLNGKKYTINLVADKIEATDAINDVKSQKVSLEASVKATDVDVTGANIHGDQTTLKATDVDVTGAAIRNDGQSTVKATEVDATQASINTGNQTKLNVGTLDASTAKVELGAVGVTIPIARFETTDALAELKGQLQAALTGVQFASSAGNGAASSVGAEATQGLVANINQATTAANTLAAAHERVLAAMQAERNMAIEVALAGDSEKSAAAQYSQVLSIMRERADLERQFTTFATQNVAVYQTFKGEVDQAVASMQNLGAPIAEQIQALQGARYILAEMRAAVVDATAASQMEADATREASQAKLQETQVDQQRLNLITQIVNASKDPATYQAMGTQLDELRAKLEDTSGTLSEQRQRIAEVRQAYAELRAERSQQTIDSEREQAANHQAVQTQLQAVRIATQRANLERQLARFAQENSAAYQVFGSSIAEMTAKLQDTSGSLDEQKLRVAEVRQQFAQLQAQMISLGTSGQSAMSRIGAGLKQVAAMFGFFSVASTVRRLFRAIVEDVKEVDAAMVELRKVTDMTAAGYDAFAEKASKAAQEIGTSLSDMLSASADFARLGFGVEDAGDLAQAALVYKNVGDGITDISFATSSLISTMKAFKIEASDAMRIVDSFNEVGKEFAHARSNTVTCRVLYRSNQVWALCA